MKWLTMTASVKRSGCKLSCADVRSHPTPVRVQQVVNHPQGIKSSATPPVLPPPGSLVRIVKKPLCCHGSAYTFVSGHPRKQHYSRRSESLALQPGSAVVEAISITVQVFLMRVAAAFTRECLIVLSRAENNNEWLWYCLRSHRSTYNQ